MSDLEDARRAVIAHPADLAARRTYANALDARHDPLGEFIRLECQLAQSSCVENEALGLWDRRLALLEAHAESWLAPLSEIAESTHIERGLVEWVCLDLDTYIARGAEIFARFPIRSMTIRGAHGRIGEILASPWTDRIEYLSLREPRFSVDRTHDLSDDDVAELSASNKLRDLRGIELGFSKRIGSRSVESILDSPWCGQLEFLGLGWTAVGDEGASRIATSDRLDNLRRLNLSNTRLGQGGVRALADSRTLARLGLTEFGLSLNHDIPPEGNARLLRSPVLARVRALSLDGRIDAELVDGFFQSDSLASLQSLSVANSWTIDTASLQRLSRWPGLARVQSLTFVLSELNDEQLEILARSHWLANLKSLLLSETRVTDDGVERLCRSLAWRGLIDLGLDRYNLTERSIGAILRAVRFPGLISLNLHATHSIGDAGASLASYRGPTRLRRLLMSMAGIGDEGALELAKAPFARQLWTLWLLGNEAVSPATFDRLKKCLPGRVYTDESDVPESWRGQPGRRARCSSRRAHLASPIMEHVELGAI
jgi:uncharacterized protein (TIGR02996 family)